MLCGERLMNKYSLKVTLILCQYCGFVYYFLLFADIRMILPFTVILCIC